MSALDTIVIAIQNVLQDSAYTDPIIFDKVNEALLSIAAGIRMPDGTVSPPLPDLYYYGSVSTSITLPYVSLPDNYHRGILKIYDSSNNVIKPPRGGNYYAYNRFLNQINSLDLSETGEVYILCVKGSKLYYQGIPPTSTTLGLHYYRKPIVMTLDGDIPEGIPDHIQKPILKHYVCKEIFGEKIEDGQDNAGIGVKYHTSKFYDYMINLVDFIGRDSEPMYYGDSGSEDAGSCDG